MLSHRSRSVRGAPWLAALLLTTSLGAAEDPTALLGQARKILVEDRNEETSRAAISGLARTASPEARVAILSAVADARPAWAGSFAGEALADPSSAVRAMAITALGKTWPTHLDDLDRVRRLLGDSDPAVVLAAAGFINRVQDDGALPILVDRLEGDPTGTIRKTMISLAGPDPGTTAAWRERLMERNTRLVGLAEAIRLGQANKNPDVVREAIQQLPTLRNQKVEAGLLLQDLIGSGDPAVSRLARETLANLGGPVHDCLVKTEALKATGPNAKTAPSKALQVVELAPAPPTPPLIDPAGLVVGLIICGILGAIGWMLWSVKPIREATRRITRAATQRFTKSIVNPARKAGRHLTTSITRPAKNSMKALTARISKPKAKPPT